MSPPARTARQIRKNILVSVAGSAIEWYDFFIYASPSALVLTSTQQEPHPDVVRAWTTVEHRRAAASVAR